MHIEPLSSLDVRTFNEMNTPAEWLKVEKNGRNDVILGKLEAIARVSAIEWHHSLFRRTTNGVTEFVYPQGLLPGASELVRRGLGENQCTQLARRLAPDDFCDVDGLIAAKQFRGISQSLYAAVAGFCVDRHLPWYLLTEADLNSKQKRITHFVPKWIGESLVVLLGALVKRNRSAADQALAAMLGCDEACLGKQVMALMNRAASLPERHRREEAKGAKQ